MNDLRQQCHEAQALGLEKIELNLAVVINILDRIEIIQVLIEKQSTLIERLKESIGS